MRRVYRITRLKNLLSRTRKGGNRNPCPPPLGFQHCDENSQAYLDLCEVLFGRQRLARNSYSGGLGFGFSGTRFIQCLLDFAEHDSHQIPLIP